MTKGHNQERSKQSNPEPRSSTTQGQSHHKTDQKQDKSPDQGRNSNKEQSGGTKGKNAN